MCGFGIFIALRQSNCVVKGQMYIEINLESKFTLSCRYPVQNYDVTKKVTLLIMRLELKQMPTSSQTLPTKPWFS